MRYVHILLVLMLLGTTASAQTLPLRLMPSSLQDLANGVSDLQVNSLGIGGSAPGDAGHMLLYTSSVTPTTPTGSAIIYYNGTRIRFLDSNGLKGRLWIYDLLVDGKISTSQIEGAGGSPLCALYWFCDNTSSDPVITTDTTLDKHRHFVKLDASGGSITITLPNTGISTGQQYTFKVVTSPGSNTITIDGNGANIDGSSTYTGLTAQYQSINLQYDGTDWWIY